MCLPKINKKKRTMLRIFKSFLRFLDFFKFLLFIGEAIDMDDVEDIMEDLGIEFTDKELLRLMESLQADGKCSK